RWSRGRCASSRVPSYGPSLSSFLPGAGAFCFGFAFGACLPPACSAAFGLAREAAFGLAREAAFGLAGAAFAVSDAGAFAVVAAFFCALISLTSMRVRAWRWPVRRL